MTYGKRINHRGWSYMVNNLINSVWYLVLCEKLSRKFVRLHQVAVDLIGGGTNINNVEKIVYLTIRFGYITK